MKFEYLIDNKNEVVIATENELIITISKDDHSIVIEDDFDNSRVCKSIFCRFDSAFDAKEAARAILEYFGDEL